MYLNLIVTTHPNSELISMEVSMILVNCKHYYIKIFNLAFGGFYLLLKTDYCNYDLGYACVINPVPGIQRGVGLYYIYF